MGVRKGCQWGVREGCGALRAGGREAQPSSPPVRCEMSWTAALTNPAAFGMSPDEKEGAMVYIYEKLAVE